jgi:hypothetical protein
MVDKFLNNIGTPKTNVNYQLGFKETIVRSEFDGRTIELIVTNYPEHEVVNDIDVVTDKMIVRFWEDDKQIELTVEQSYLDKLIEQTKLTEQEKDEFLKARFNAMLALYIKLGRQDG